MASNDSSIIKVGPEGSLRGSVWDHKGRNKIVQIFISHSNEINSIQFQYADDYGSLMLSERIGSKHTSNFDVVKLDYQHEYITWITGRKCYSKVLRIKFGTNRGEYGPFGRLYNSKYGIEEDFRFSLGDRQFFGFHGTANESDGLTSIGVYIKPNVTTQ